MLASLLAVFAGPTASPDPLDGVDSAVANDPWDFDTDNPDVYALWHDHAFDIYVLAHGAALVAVDDPATVEDERTPRWGGGTYDTARYDYSANVTHSRFHNASRADGFLDVLKSFPAGGNDVAREMEASAALRAAHLVFVCDPEYLTRSGFITQADPPSLAAITIFQGVLPKGGLGTWWGVQITCWP